MGMIARASSIWAAVTLLRPMDLTLPCRSRLGKRADRIGERDARIGPVELVEADLLHAERL